MKRIVLAGIVLLAGVGGLSAAWWVTAQRALDAEVRLEAQRLELAAAERLAQQLENVRRTENDRPWFHYQNLYHDPKGAAQGLAVTPSPIAGGTGSPLITAHFQIDGAQKVSLPTLNEELEDLSAKNAGEQRAIRDAIARSIPSIRTIAAPLMARVESDAREQRVAAERIAQLEARVEDARGPQTSSPVVPEAKIPQAAKVETLPSAAFAQNVQANTIFQQLNVDLPSEPVQAEAPRIPQRRARPRSEPPVRIWTSDLEWRTLAVDDRVALVALRAVQTPNGTLVQGVLTPLAEGAIVDGMRVTRAKEGSAVGDTGWRVRVAMPPHDRERGRFLRNFLAVSTVLVLVVAGVIWTLWRVERLARDRARFAATAAHELRTPLASLRLYSDLVGEEEDAAKRAHYAGEIASQTERLGRVVANVLEVTRLERGAFALRPRAGAIGPAVEECIARLRPQMEAAQCPLRLHIDDDLPEISFDPDALDHVVVNLVDNAEKFSRDAPERAIDVAVERAEGGVAITVRDRGPGLPESLLRDPRPFRRGTKAGGPAGLGLGLYLVDRIVRGHGGTIEAASHPGGGSVRVFLPAFYRS